MLKIFTNISLFVPWIRHRRTGYLRSTQATGFCFIVSLYTACRINLIDKPVPAGHLAIRLRRKAMLTSDAIERLKTFRGENIDGLAVRPYYQM